MSLGFWLKWARAFRYHLLLISALTLLSSIATLAVPWLAAQLLGGVLFQQNGAAAGVDLSQILLLLVGTLVAVTSINIGAAIASQTASLRILTELRKEIYAHVQSLPLSFHDDARAGEVLALTSYEVGNLSDFLADTLANAPAMLLTAIGATFVLFWLDPAMALVVPILIPIFFVTMRLAGRRLRRVSSKVRAAEVELISIAERDIAMLPAIKAFATEAFHKVGFSLAAENSRILAVSQARLNALIGPVSTLVVALAAIAVLVVAGQQLTDGNRSPAEFFAFLLYAALLTRPIGQLASIYGAYQMARGTLERLEAVLGIEPEAGYDRGDPLDRSAGAIRFEQVSFAYPDRPSLFTELSLEVDAGEIVALTGDNGVGKSTLVRLLLRFYSPVGGRILIDEKDIADLQIQNLRRQFGYVPQRPLLFNGTIADNIAFGQSSERDEGRLLQAVKLAQAAEFIEALPNRFETEIGDHGIRLSGGQQQRLALARALYRDPPIYILDEATSMYDLESEAAFVEDCLQSLRGRTVIVITHRPASLALADRVLKLGPDGVHLDSQTLA